MVSVKRANILPQSNYKNEVKCKRPGAGAIAGGVLAGMVVNNVAKVPTQIVSSKVVGYMQDVSDSLSPSDLKLIDDSIIKKVNDSGLAKKRCHCY